MIVVAVAIVTIVSGRPAATEAGCNLIPPAEQAFPSTTGSITSPITTVGDSVEIRLTSCDASAGFDPTPANNQVAITFLPAGVGQPPPVIVAAGAITIDGCAGVATPPCSRLRFTMPATPNLAGPAAITVQVGGTTVADVGPLFQARLLGSTCDKLPEGIFQQFTVLPPANDFGDLASGAAPPLLATLDGSGSLLLPFDYRQVLPLGPGEPVARLISGATSLDAFPATPALDPIDVPTSYVRSFTVDGRPLPPLLRATDAGNQIFGATDAAVAVIRVARDGDAGVKFDLASLRTNGGYGPIVIPSSQYSFTSNAPIPLENLHSTATGVAYTRDEGLEGNLNGASGDIDASDHVVQVIDVGGFNNTNTGMAASATHNPIVGGAALDVSPNLAAFFESEAAQNATDLNGDGDALDDVLRVFDVAGTQLTPSATLVGNPFPGINRKPVAIDGALVFYREAQPGLDPGATFGGPYDLAVSPDGRYLYQLAGPAQSGGQITATHLDSQTGGPQRDFGANVTLGDLDGATGIDVSPDSHFVFAAVKGLNQLESVEVEYDLNGLVFWHRADYPLPFGGGGQLIQGEGGVDGLTGVTDVAASPDGKHVYAVADGDDAVTAAAVDSAHGALTFVQTIKNGAGVSDMVDPIRLVVSADGKNVYVAAHGSSAVQVLTRNATTGVLTPQQSLLDGGTGGPSLGGITDIAVSADGKNVYATSEGDSAVTIFSRDPGTGALTFVTALLDGIGGITNLTQAKGIAVSPDGTAVYVTTAFGRLLVFSRQMPGGGLSYVENHGVDFAVPLNTGHLAVAPDSEHVYQAFDAGAPLSSFTRRGALHAFDTATTSLRPGLAGAGASTAAVGGGRAVFTTAGGLGNVQLYDAGSDTVTQIGNGVAAKKVALSANLLAMIVPESALSADANKDGDTHDDVVLVTSPANPTAAPKALPIQTEEIAVTDLCLGGANTGRPCIVPGDCPDGTCRGLVVGAANEFAYKDNGESPHPLSADFNHNDKVTDVLVLWVYDSGTKKLVNLGWQAYDFVVGGHLLAFRTSESEHKVDLDGNITEPTDTVMMIYDLATGSFINPAAAVVKCDLPGCEPGLPYKIKGDSVVFLVPEGVQGRDLDGDGPLTHTVVMVYNVATATTQVLSSVNDVGTLQQPTSAVGTPPLLPTTFTDGTIVYKQVKESDIGRDINEDGDFDDVVTLVDGDSDGDGVFDGGDVCTETSDPSQLDTDGDTLPDACDPNAYCAVLLPPAPPVPPPTAVPCQKVVGKLIRQLVITQEKATRACLDQIGAGKLVGEPSLLCRGGVATGVPVLPGDAKTAGKIQKAVAKISSLSAKCPDGALGDLAACATTGPPQCAAARATSSVVLASAAAYGRVGSIADKAARGCQKAIGKAAGGYLATAVKAMGECLDKLNAGDLTGSGASLCLGAGTSSGFTLPTDPKTADRLQKAADNLTAALAKACPGSVAAGLNACATDAVGLAGCLQCANVRQAITMTRAAYGPP